MPPLIHGLHSEEMQSASGDQVALKEAEASASPDVHGDKAVR